MPRLLHPLILAFMLVGASLAGAKGQTPGLGLSDGQITRTLTRDELLADPGLRVISIAPDPVYRRAMTYRAVPVATLLRGLRIGAEDYLQVRAEDGFAVSLPAGLLLRADPGKAQAFLAIETPEAPWPVLPVENQHTSAGPFYLVWAGADRAGIGSEYWAFRVAQLSVTASPAQRWPGLGVGADIAAGDPIRRGLDRFVAVCMVCHRFAGAGDADLGPDLARPMNPVEYFQPAALRQYLRDPGALRSWPERKMPAFDQDALSDADIDAVIAWLGYKARHRP